MTLSSFFLFNARTWLQLNTILKRIQYINMEHILNVKLI